MGIFLSVLVASVGAMDLINCLAYVADRLTASGAPVTDADLVRYRQLLKEKIEETPRGAAPGLTIAQDGVLYKDGYRVEQFDDERLDLLNAKIRELEHKSQEKDHKLDMLNVKLDELERKSAERELVFEELQRSRSVSRASSQEPGTSRSIPHIVLDADEVRQGSNRFRPIHREDDFRRTIKKRSVTSNVSEDRTDELDLLTKMEEDEAGKMEDYVPLVYNRAEYLDAGSKRHKISPIQEMCQMHEDEEHHRIMERSPEPSSGADYTKPWGDIRLEETKMHEKLHPAPGQAIEEETRDSDSSLLEENDALAKSLEETHQWLQSPRNAFHEPPKPETAIQTPNDSVPSNLSSHSNSPDSDHPTLKRTRKKSDLTALLLEEERRAEAYSGIIIQTEESDSEVGQRTGFLQSKSPSPYVGAFLENERLQQSSGQLIPLVAEQLQQEQERSVSQEYHQLSATPSRDATISPAPIGSSGSPASPISSIVDESVKDGLPYQSGDDQSFGSSPRIAHESEPNVSRDGSVSLASSSAACSASLDLHVDLAPTTPSPSPPPIQAAAIDRDHAGAGGVVRHDSKSPSAEETRQPRRFRARTRKIRSLTPIDFNQTFMDEFADQRFSVSPSELEDYINSLDEIKIVPPEPVTPNYFLPTTPMTSGVPSLIVTDEKGEDARFHDSLSSKGFYGSNRLDPGRVLNHRVSYVEWIKKFPENMTSHLELQDYDSDDEEVEKIINGAQKVEVVEVVSSPKFPVDVPPYVTPSPEPLRDLPVSPEVPPEMPQEARTEFPLNVAPSYATPSPVSQISEISVSSESMIESSSLPLGSPLLNSIPSPDVHFTPISSPMASLKSPTPDRHSLSPRPIPKLFIPSRSPTVSPIPIDMTPEEAIFDIGHLDGLIFETRSRSATPQPQSLQTPLSPEELAYDIGNLGGLILGPPSRSTSPFLPSSPSPTPGSSLSPLSSPWTSLQPPTLGSSLNTSASTDSDSSETRSNVSHANTNNT